ncbi:MAG: ATP-binding cassette domain-containing protein [Spirochaetes bacterium]|nr:ATP-binding cassette domain-containing protein [Spirochaetota bacterium]
MNAIEVDTLTRKFGKAVAVDGISFSVAKGEIFGFLGPNGAGKTTTINVLSTLLKPTSGKASIMGHDIRKERDQVRRSIGVVFQEPALDGRLTGAENLSFHAMMYGMKSAERKARMKEVLELVELTDQANKKVDAYSGGMKRRLEIARGLMHHPEVLFLDEPTIGLDAQTRRHIWEYVKKLNAETGITMMLTTHYMEEADFLAHRILIIDHGKIVALDTPKALKDVLGGDVVELLVEDKADKLLACCKVTKWIRSSSKHEDTVRLTMQTAEKRIPDIMKLATAAGATVSSVTMHKPSLDDVFMHFTGKAIREADAAVGKGKKDANH